MTEIIMSKFKILNHLDIIKKIAAGDFSGAPISAEIDISNYCNNDCSFCAYKDYLLREQTKIGYDDFCRVVNELVGFGVKSLGFTGGGEPLTNDRAVDIMSYAKSIGLEVALVTNGGLLREEFFESLISSCTYIRFSISAAKNKTFQKVQRPRNNQNLAEVLGKIQQLVEKRNAMKLKIPLLGIAFLVCTENLEEIHAAAQLAELCGVDYIVYRPAVSGEGRPPGQISPASYDFVLSEISRSISDFNSPDFMVSSSLAMSCVQELSDFSRKSFRTCRGHGLVAIILANLKCHFAVSLEVTRI